ncbi:transketolase [Deinococcus misasensis]|uniref:transketolase n=1 Tax=Deinococcus misasensis TaxID=392413 RepID=UPI000557CFEE|nr:transketolase [Deinococcus misasensis]
MISTETLKARALQIRKLSVQMVSRVNASHIGSSFSMVELLTVLYSHFLKIDPARPQDPARDRFILSKGHAAASLYATLAVHGFIDGSELEEYNLPGSRLLGHASHKVPGVELSTGSLGHGLPVGCGLALAAKRLGRRHRTVVLVSDGELDEGSNWEAILFAPHHKLDNLLLVVDYNKIQSLGNVKDVLDLHPLAEKFETFGWHVKEIDGHDVEQIRSALDNFAEVQGRPMVILAHTVKGKGVSYMENLLAWHYKSPNQEQLAQALQELEEQQ